LQNPACGAKHAAAGSYTAHLDTYLRDGDLSALAQ
jgi:hypothetical protein